ncbi:fibroblast growth factor receptor 1-like isoform X2, partial [Dinothrombium tinctorium]
PYFFKMRMSLSYNSRDSGQSMRFKCPFDGNPLPSITWLKNGGQLYRENGYPISFPKRSHLLLENLTERDSGNYTCVVSNLFGSINATFWLVVRDFYPHAPIFERGKNETVYAARHSNVELDCTFDQDFETEWLWARVWKLESENFTAFEGSFVTIDGWLIKPLKYTGDNTTFRLYNITDEDEGIYMCFARNIYGNSSRSIYLKLQSSAKSEKRIYQFNKPILNIYLVIFAGVFITLALGCSFVILCSCRKKNFAPTINAEKTYIIQKRVIIDRINKSCNNLLIPEIKIEEKQSESEPPPNYDKIVVNYEIPIDEKWEIDRESISLGEKLGEGAFGVVHKGKLRMIDHETDIAIKMVKNGCRDEDVVALLEEVEIMKRVGNHRNVVSLIGCCTQDSPILLIMECASNGSLKNFLEKLVNYPNQMKTDDLISFALQIAEGMEHLAFVGCIHRDLAARNVLMSGENVLKISDFGLARKSFGSGYYKIKSMDQRLPVRWLAPEAWKSGKFSTKSDVWSFGVLMWEIFSFGLKPYKEIEDIDILLAHINSGYRLQRPENCSSFIYDLMLLCWDEEPNNRPDFSEIKLKLNST